MDVSVAISPLLDSPPTWVESTLTGSDRNKLQASRNPRRFREILWSRGLKHSLSTRLAETAPDENFPDKDRFIRCSIAHDRIYAAAAVSSTVNIGFDLQSDRSLDSCVQIAEAWFPEMERNEISKSISCERFLLSWVVKEAWAKWSNRSIFEACDKIAVWNNKVHLAENQMFAPRFAWLRLDINADMGIFRRIDSMQSNPRSAANLDGFAMGICLEAETKILPTIECLIPDAKLNLHRLPLSWNWLAVVK